MRDRRRRRRRLRRKGAWRRSIPGNKILTFFLTCLSSSGGPENLRGVEYRGRGGRGRRRRRVKGRATIRRREGGNSLHHQTRVMVCIVFVCVRRQNTTARILTWGDLHTLSPLPSFSRGSEKNGWTRENIPKVWMPPGILFHVGSTTGGEGGDCVIENSLITFLERKISLDLFLEDWRWWIRSVTNY